MSRLTIFLPALGRILAGFAAALLLGEAAAWGCRRRTSATGATTID
jgi:hypothetical protein